MFNFMDCGLYIVYLYDTYLILPEKIIFKHDIKSNKLHKMRKLKKQMKKFKKNTNKQE